MDARFALRNYGGDPRQFFLLESKQIADDSTTIVDAEPSHHIFVLDCSGSMYYEIANVRQTVEKVLTLEEYKNSDTLISVVSYASNGDLKTHFARAKVSEIGAPGSIYVEEIRKLRARGLTCMSQGLRKAKELVKDGELTCISLHSDGYANDRSPTQERREIDAILKDFSGMDNVFINTIAYRQWSDFKLLSAIANAASGTCIQALNIKQVFDALHDTTTLLAGTPAPAISSEIDDFDYQVFVSKAARKVNGADTYLAIRGLSPTDDKTVYRFKEVNEATYNASTLPVCGDGADIGAVVAFSRAQLAEGNINTSKFAMVAVRDATLLDTHAKALTSEEIAALTSELEVCLFDGIPANHTRTTDYGLDTSRASVLAIVAVLSQYPGQMSVDLQELRGHYKKRGVKRIAGKRNEDGTVDAPWLDTIFKDGEGNFAKVLSWDINRNNATINMMVRRGIDLVERDSRNVVSSVASVDISNLSSFNNYTIVGDGSVNTDYIDVKFHSKKLFRDLVALGVLDDGDYNPEDTYRLEFGSRPLVDYDQTFTSVDGVYPKLLRFKVLSSLLAALSKGGSVDFTSDQVAELKRHYLSPALYVSFPSTNAYTDVNDALASGVIDTRLSYKVDIGNSSIVNQSKLKSANAYLKRRFAVDGTDVDPKKPNMMDWWKDDFSVTLKSLSARTKLDAVDNVTMPFFEEFFGLGDGTSVIAPVLESAGADSTFVGLFNDLIARNLSEDAATEVIDEAKLLLKKATTALYEEKVCPLAFYIGSTGLLPDEFDTKALTAEQLVEKHPGIKLAKAEKEGTFFEVGDTILSVFVKGEYFSTGQTAPPASAK